MIIKSAEELHGFIKKILLAVGATDQNAEMVTEHLVLANLSGVDTHGILMLPRYVRAVKAGSIIATARPEILSETSTSARVTGKETFGQVAAKFSMEVAIEKATQHNVAVVALIHAHHIGRVGHYSELAASQGMISMIYAAGPSDPVAVPHGGRKRALHTNPVSMGFPAGEEPPMILDYATTASSRIKVVNAKRSNQDVPPDWIVDKEGNPTTNPDDFLQRGGALLPFGKHKGYALMLAAEYLGRIFPRAEEFATQGWEGPNLSRAGATMVVFRASLFQPEDDYRRQADELERRLRGVPPASGFQEVLVPGDPERLARRTRRREGIPIPEDIWESISKLATSLGVIS